MLGCGHGPPHVIINGDTDIVASTSNVQKIVAMANNKNLKLCIIKNTGHIPSTEGYNAIKNELIKLVYE